MAVKTFMNTVTRCRLSHVKICEEESSSTHTKLSEWEVQQSSTVVEITCWKMVGREVLFVGG